MTAKLITRRIKSLDELVMQIYRPTSQEVALAINNSILSEIEQYVDVGIGIYAGSLENQKSLSEIQKQVEVVKQHGYGYAIFPWETSLGLIRWEKREQKETYLRAI